MAWKDGSEKPDVSETHEGKDTAEDKKNKAESDRIGDELSGARTKGTGETKEGDSPESTKNGGLEKESDVRKASGRIGKELNGEDVKETFDASEKRNIDGEKITGPPKLKSEEFALKGPDGKPILDANGNPKVNWDYNAKYEDKDTPGADSRYEIKQTTLKPGEVIDRYGDERGTFASPEGEPYDKRALPYEEKTCEYHKYRVREPVECTESTAAPKFDSEGGAKQYEFNKSFREMLDDDELEEIE